MELTILGCGSAIPLPSRGASAQIIRIDQENILIDCGEATQIQLRTFKVRLQQITTVLISHMHGDHYFGLPGLINSMQLLGRTAPLTIYGPEALEAWIKMSLQASYTRLRFSLNFFVTSYGKAEVIVDHKKYTITSFPLKHQIPTTGFRIQEKQKPAHMRGELVKELNIPHYLIDGIKKGDDYTTEDGRKIPHRQLTRPAAHPKSYAYCSDTKYDENIVQHIAGVNVLYHESTFLEALSARAKKTFHSTALEAATIAKKANVKRLILGHFSARYKELDDFIVEAKLMFDNVSVAFDGMVEQI